MKSKEAKLKVANERNALMTSLLGALVMTGLGVGFFVLTRSEAILLDAVFNAVTFAMSVLTLRVAALIHGRDSERFPFGYFSFEVMVNTIKGAIILVISVGAAASAIHSIIGGGRELELGFASVYAVLATAISSIVFLVLRKRARVLHSPLVDLDAFNWRVNALISAAVAVAFIVAFVLQDTPWSAVAVYVDPVLVLLLVLGIMKFPIDIVRHGVFQLLLAAPDPELQAKCSAQLDTVLHRPAYKRVSVRMSQVGRLLYIQVQVLVGDDDGPQSLDDQDSVRSRIASALEGLHPELVVDVLFTHQSRWLD